MRPWESAVPQRREPPLRVWDSWRTGAGCRQRPGARRSGFGRQPMCPLLDPHVQRDPPNVFYFSLAAAGWAHLRILKWAHLRILKCAHVRILKWAHWGARTLGGENVRQDSP